MIEKKKKIIITFFTTTDAMNMEDVCKKCKADGRLIPVPGFITADCGLAWCADPESEAELTEIMHKNDIVCQEIYICMI